MSKVKRFRTVVLPGCKNKRCKEKYDDGLLVFFGKKFRERKEFLETVHDVLFRSWRCCKIHSYVNRIPSFSGVNV